MGGPGGVTCLTAVGDGLTAGGLTAGAGGLTAVGEGLTAGGPAGRTAGDCRTGCGCLTGWVGIFDPFVS
mgnify:FL=1